MWQDLLYKRVSTGWLSSILKAFRQAYVHNNYWLRRYRETSIKNKTLLVWESVIESACLAWVRPWAPAQNHKPKKQPCTVHALSRSHILTWNNNNDDKEIILFIEINFFFLERKPAIDTAWWGSTCLALRVCEAWAPLSQGEGAGERRVKWN